MKHALTVALAALTLAGCQKSVDQQFRAMCRDQKAGDPVAWASSEGACGQADNLSEDQKKALLDAYAELQKARQAVEQ